MQEKDMVNDVLHMLGANIKNYSEIIIQSANHELRQAVTQLRNRDEAFQYRLLKIAEQKGYTKPTAPADKRDIQRVRSEFKQ